MKRLLRYWLLAVFVSTILGCGLAAREIKTRAQSERTDIFREVNEESPPTKGLVDLEIKTSVKTHLENYYFIEFKNSAHGKPEYPFLVNIDGQASLWKVTGQIEVTPKYDESRKRIPEGGEGMRYVLDRKVRLASGPHNIFFGLPGEDYFIEFNLTLMEGEVNLLEFQPGYRSTRGQGTQSFLNGVKNGQVFLNKNLLVQ
jgi:hypothetical protein